MFSFYKEFHDERDEMNLLRCYARCDETTIEEALEKLTNDTIVRSEQLMYVFHDKDSGIFDSLKKYMHSNITFHFTDPRYRMPEIPAFAVDQTIEEVSKYLAYHKHAQEVDCVEAWAYLTVLEYAAEEKNL